MNHYRGTFIVLGLLLISAVSSLAICTWWRGQQTRLAASAAIDATRLAHEKNEAEEGARIHSESIQPLRKFALAWEKARRPAPGKDLGNHLRNALSTLATRTGLTSDGATVPGEPRSYAVGGSLIKVQQISVSVVGESLPGVLTWLGEVENQFPYARVESLSLSGYASHSVQLEITLLHPVDESDLPVSTFEVVQK